MQMKFIILYFRHRQLFNDNINFLKIKATRLKPYAYAKITPD